MDKWDFKTELGDKIKEEHKHLYVTIREVPNLINRQPIDEKIRLRRYEREFEMSEAANRYFPIGANMVSVLTAAIIQSRDDIEVSAGGPAENGKYVGWITLGEDDYYRPLLNSEPIYDSIEEATKKMQEVVDEIRSKDVVDLFTTLTPKEGDS